MQSTVVNSQSVFEKKRRDLYENYKNETDPIKLGYCLYVYSHQPVKFDNYGTAVHIADIAKQNGVEWNNDISGLTAQLRRMIWHIQRLPCDTMHNKIIEKLDTVIEFPQPWNHCQKVQNEIRLQLYETYKDETDPIRLGYCLYVYSRQPIEGDFHGLAVHIAGIAKQNGVEWNNDISGLSDRLRKMIRLSQCLPFDKIKMHNKIEKLDKVIEFPEHSAHWNQRQKVQNEKRLEFYENYKNETDPIRLGYCLYVYSHQPIEGDYLGLAVHIAGIAKQNGVEWNNDVECLSGRLQRLIRHIQCLDFDKMHTSNKMFEKLDKVIEFPKHCSLLKPSQPEKVQNEVTAELNGESSEKPQTIQSTHSKLYLLCEPFQNDTNPILNGYVSWLHLEPGNKYKEVIGTARDLVAVAEKTGQEWGNDVRRVSKRVWGLMQHVKKFKLYKKEDCLKLLRTPFNFPLNPVIRRQQPAWMNLPDNWQSNIKTLKTDCQWCVIHRETVAERICKQKKTLSEIDKICDPMKTLRKLYRADKVRAKREIKLRQKIYKLRRNISKSNTKACLIQKAFTDSPSSPRNWTKKKQVRQLNTEQIKQLKCYKTNIKMVKQLYSKKETLLEIRNDKLESELKTLKTENQVLLNALETTKEIQIELNLQQNEFSLKKNTEALFTK